MRRDHPLREIVEAALQASADDVADWRAGRPGAWGRIASQAVLAVRRARGRSLTEAERRAVWAIAWASLAAPDRSQREVTGEGGL